ncbi:P-loop containing nucleoside triphosphate hydrolase protein [Hypoxylon trugodes]|uniref:P-loop containing nucleoside triphosphate hydrolase protein n=1 Tax=Hypoxylon trugodes TaxID=326681 RepID=UPI0021A1F01D|nr:P-loop containing nucleoside triphosphate hydrolase protein [Hypoxylon trugodes]KAI1394197.1 P-loop containing nucleoside triphosphate hydrolase protein [Hypoxylon trugodes]
MVFGEYRSLRNHPTRLRSLRQNWICMPNSPPLTRGNPLKSLDSSSLGDEEVQKPSPTRILKSRAIPPVPEERLPCPKASANGLSRTTASWIQPLLSVGRRRTLETNDIWLVNPERSIETLREKFGASFEYKHSLALALYVTSVREFWIGGIWQLAASLCQVGIPLVLRFLLSFVTEKYQAENALSKGDMEGPALWKGLSLVAGLLLLQFVQGIGVNQFSYHGSMMGVQSRGVLIAAIFEKFMKLPVQLHGTNAGASYSTMNLMSSDTNHISQAAGAFHLVWTAPITIALAIVLVLDTLTYSAIPGIFLLLFGVQGLTLAVKWIGRLKPVLRQFTNARVSLTREVLQHISFVKYNTLEDHFLDEIGRHRTKELGIILRVLTIRNFMFAASTCLPVMASVLSLSVYSATGHHLMAPTVFSSVVVFNTLRVPFASMSVSLRQVAEGWAAVKRLQKFLDSEESKEESVWDINSEFAVSVERGKFARAISPNARENAETSGHDEHHTQGPPFSLADTDFSIPRGELIAVVGTTGSGKSSLLCALAGQIPKISGKVTIGVASRAICSQDAWIQSASVKDNILFGKPMNREVYDRIIKACALTLDIEALPEGENTKVGERGASLSGGQCQRINLARAVYANSDLVLLDDPLSAVDANVGQHLFNEVILDELGGKTRFLVTNQRKYLAWCDKVLWMENGRIRAMRSYLKLYQSEPDFHTMLETTASNEKEKLFGGSLPDKAPTRARGHLHVFNRYFRSSGHLCNSAIPVLFLVLAQGTGTMTSLWLSYWTSNKFAWLSRNQYAFMTFGLAFSLPIIGNRASRRLLNQAVAKPLGHVLHPFADNAEAMDQQFPESLTTFPCSIAAISSTFIVIQCYYPWFSVMSVPLFFGCICILRDFETKLRGDVLSMFSESIAGAGTIKAYGKHHHLLRRLCDSIDVMNASLFLLSGAQLWLTTRLNLKALIVIIVAGTLIICNGVHVEPSVSGLIQLLVQQIGQLEDRVHSLSFLLDFVLEIRREFFHRWGVSDLPKGWPTEGDITITGVNMRHGPNRPMVLKDFNIHIQQEEKIGLVGRTGVGKSSLAAVLFRFVELTSGTIIIDGWDIQRIPLHILRSGISIITQRPTFFRGTIRSNLDPCGQHTEEHAHRYLR